MRPLALVTALAPACLGILAVPAAAQELHPPWQTIRDLEFHGASIPADQLTKGLFADVDILKLLSRPITATDMPDIAAALARFYRANGYAEAQITAELESGIGVVEIAEGRRRTCGTIRCAGNATLSTERIRDTVIGPPDKGGIWRDGKPAPIDADSLRRYELAVRRAGLVEGLHGARFAVRTELRDDVVDLVVTFENEGKRVTVQSLELLGEDETAQAAVLSQLRWQPGDVATHGWVEDIRQQLEALGRYRSVRIPIADDPPAKFDPLTIHVEVLPHARLLTPKEQADLAQLQRGIDWATNYLESALTLRFEKKLAAQSFLGIRLSNSALTAEAARGGWRVVLPELFEIIMSENAVSLQFGAVAADFDFATRIGIHASARSTFGAKGQCEFRWGFGATRKARETALLDIQLHPATAGYLLYGPEPVFVRQGDDLVAEAGDGRFAITPSGEPRDRHNQLLDDLRIEFSGATLADLRQSFRERHPAALQSFHELLGQAIPELLGPWLDRERDSAEKADALLLGLARALGRSGPTPSNAAVPRQYRVANSSTENVMPEMAFILATRPQVAGWPSDIIGAVGTMMLGHAGAGWDCVRRFADEETHGPVAMLAGRAAMAFLGAKPAADRFHALANQRWSFDAFYDDLAIVGANLERAAELRTAIVTEWRSVPRLAALFEGARTDDATLRLGMRALWDAGIGERLRELVFPD